jgi:hypothetical protein
MPISFFRGVDWTFSERHLDLRGQDRRPSLGPHILAGVKGSGKSTILKAVAWCLAESEHGFAEAAPKSTRIVGFRHLCRGAQKGSARGFVVVGERNDGRGRAESHRLPTSQRSGRQVSCGFLSAARKEAKEQDDAIEVSLYIKRVIANERGEPTSRYTAVCDALERGLTRVPDLREVQ